MALTPAIMAQMDLGHLLAAVEAEYDPLTRTPLEDELINRITAIDDEANDAITSAAGEFDLSAEDIQTLGNALILSTRNTAALLEVIGDVGIDSPETLKRELEVARQFRDITADAGDVLFRLSNLITTAQE